MGPTLSLVGVLVVSLGAFVVATTYDHQNPIEQMVGFAIGVTMMLVGIGLFITGWWL